MYDIEILYAFDKKDTEAKIHFYFYFTNMVSVILGSFYHTDVCFFVLVFLISSIVISCLML